MKLIRISANVRELLLDDGLRVLLSYSTPVAVIMPDGSTFVTDKRWSVSTTKHVSKWCGWNHPKIAQEELNKLLDDTGLEGHIGLWKVLRSHTYTIREFNQKHAKGAKS